MPTLEEAPQRITTSFELELEAEGEGRRRPSVTDSKAMPAAVERPSGIVHASVKDMEGGILQTVDAVVVM